MSPMNILLIVLTLVGNVLLGLWGRGGFEQFGLHLGLWLGATVILIGAVPPWLLAWRCDWPRVRTVAVWLMVLAGIAYSTILGFLLGSYLAKRDIRAGIAFGDSLVPRLEEFRKAHQQYPESLDLVPGLASPPAVLFGPLGPARGRFYWPATDRGSFRIEFPDPRFTTEWIFFDSAVPGWQRKNADSTGPFHLD